VKAPDIIIKASADLKEVRQALQKAWGEGHAAGRDYQADGWNSGGHDCAGQPVQGDSMKIPDAAIEAAAMALLAVTPDVWALQTTGTKDRYRWDAQAALEAAAPHMLAEAWGLGMWAMYNTTSSEWPPIPEQNPFRSDQETP
jgi:hypothetical protein